MLAPDLQAQMLHFVKTFYVVKERQLEQFFGDWGRAEARYALTGLINTGRLIRHPCETVSFARTLPKAIQHYMPGIAALEVMVMLQSKRIVFCNKEDYPVELLYATTEGELYDVVVFDDLWSVKYASLSHTKGRFPPGETDITKHVAVVPNEEIAQKVESLGFDLFAIVDYSSGHVELFNFE